MLVSCICTTPIMAEGTGKGGDEFRMTAIKYDKKSKMFSEKGMPEVARLYNRQAEIKRKAADMGDQGRWNEIDWTEYHANEEKINKLMHNNRYTKSHKK